MVLKWYLPSFYQEGGRWWFYVEAKSERGVLHAILEICESKFKKLLCTEDSKLYETTPRNRKNWGEDYV
jgi:hypothetical protein